MNIEYNPNFKTAKIIDSKGNYLVYISNIGVKRSYGKVDNREFKGSTLIWLAKGRGKVAESTWKKLYDIEKYFFKNYDIIKMTGGIKIDKTE